MTKTTTFEHGGRVYEIRAIPTLNGWMVRISSTASRQMASLIRSTPKFIKTLLSTECQKIWWPGWWKQRSVIFGAAFCRN
jgi:hypothetical protein